MMINMFRWVTNPYTVLQIKQSTIKWFNGNGSSGHLEKNGASISSKCVSSHVQWENTKQKMDKTLAPIS